MMHCFITFYGFTFILLPSYGWINIQQHIKLLILDSDFGYVLYNMHLYKIHQVYCCWFSLLIFDTFLIILSYDGRQWMTATTKTNVNRTIKLFKMFSPLIIIWVLSVLWWIGWYYMYKIKNILAFQAWRNKCKSIYWYSSNGCWCKYNISIVWSLQHKVMIW